MYAGLYVRPLATLSKPSLWDKALQVIVNQFILVSSNTSGFTHTHLQRSSSNNSNSSDRTDIPPGELA